MARTSERPKNPIIAVGILGIITVLGTLLATPVTASASAEAHPAAVSGDEVGDHRLIVTFHADSEEGDRLEAASDAGADVVDLGGTLPVAVVDVEAGAVDEATTALLADPAVAHVEADATIELEHQPNDAQLLAGLGAWGVAGPREAAGLGAAEFGADAVTAWDRGHIGSPGVHVAVLDTGIDLTHPDLAANIWRNPGEIAGNGVDDDGNGLIDDVHGWDFHDNDADVSPAISSTGSIEDHGTRAAGIIGAVGGNGIGVAGVAWHVGIVPVRSLGTSSGKASAAILAIDYVIDLKRRHGVNLVAINASWSTLSFSYALQDAVRRAGQAGITLVGAAGNHGGDNDTAPRYPASLNCSSYGYPWDCVVSVAAHDTDGLLVGEGIDWGWRTNTGATTVDLAAPGVGLITTHPGGGYAQMHGTSAATPMVTGALALCAAAAPSLAPSERARLLTQTVAPLGAATSRIASGGRLDVAAYLAACGASAAGASGYGALEQLRASTTSTATVAGWARGLAGEGAAVEISVNGATAQTVATPPVAEAPASRQTLRPAFATEVRLPDGLNEVCAGFAGAPRLLGCATVRGATQNRVSGQLTSSGPVDGAWVLDGWAIDPATAGAAPVWATVDGLRVKATEGAGPLERFAAENPGWDTGAAFSLHIDHRLLPRRAAGRLCAHAAPVAGGSEVLIGCTTVRHPGTLNPVGNLEAASTHGRGLVVTGWTFDPDRATPISVEVHVNGTRRHAATTSLRRADVAGSYPGYTQPSGFRVVLPELLAAGRHQVCVIAINEGLGSANTQLGCRTVTARGGNPIGSIDGARRTASGVRITGWALDHDTQGATSVHLYANGRFVRAVQADTERRDVAAAHPAYGPRHGLDVTVGLPKGNQRVCAYAINVGPGSTNTALGCRTVA